MLTESIMLGSEARGLLLAYWGSKLLINLIPPNTIPAIRLHGIGINAPVLLFTLGLNC